MLSDQELDALRVECQTIGVVEWADHQIVFRRPNRPQIMTFRCQVDKGGAEKANAADQLCQLILVSFDGERDRVKALQLFGAFMDQVPMFASSDKCQAVLNVLCGTVEEEAEARLGKGARILSGRPKT